MLSSRRPPQSIQIDEEAFRRLIAGQPVLMSAYGRPVEIALNGVSPMYMLDAVVAAIKAAAPPPDPPEAREFLPQHHRRGKPGK